MSTRKTASKTASKTPAAKPARTAPKAQGGPAAAAARRGAPVATADSRTAASKPAATAPMPATEAQASNRPAQAPTGEARYRWIAHAAYLRAEKRGFAPGQEVDDWLAAEADFRAACGGS